MRRPDVFTLDYSHPLAQGLVFAGLCHLSNGFNDLTGRVITQLSGYSEPFFTDVSGRRSLIVGKGLGINPVFSQNSFNNSDEWCVSCRINIYPNSVDGYPSVVCRQTGNNDLIGFRAGTRSSCIRFGYNEVRSTAWGGDSTSAFVGDNFWAWNRKIGSVDFYKNTTVSNVSTTNSFNFSVVGRFFGEGNSSYSFFPGAATDLLVHNRALSPAEIAILADRTDPMLGGLIVEERPVLYFDMGGSTVDELTASNLTVSSPVLGTPSLGQAHALAASGTTVEGPVLGAPTLAQIHALVASGLTVSAPVVGTPAVGQVHALTAAGLAVSSPVLGTPTLVESGTPVDALTADDLTTGSPALGTPTFGQIHVLGTDGLVTGAPVLGQPTITQIHALTALGLTVGAPVLGSPTLADYEVTAISADEVGRSISLQARNYRATLAKRNYTARL